MREATASAPGRVNLIGEHTDYHEGFVLPCTVPQRTTAVVRRRSDRRVDAVSANVPGRPLAYELGAETPGAGWGDYVQGVTSALARAGHRVTGFDVHLESTVPLGAGLSSSAALEVALLRALRALFALAIDDVEIARLGQRAETDFVGAPVGIMDQMASSLGAPGQALFLDTRSLFIEAIPLPSALGLIVIDSGVVHQHAGGGYVARRAESERAARQLGVRYLRDVSIDELPRLASLPPVEGRRARHVVTENARVIQAADALRRSDLKRLGDLFVRSHVSMRDDYEISTPEIDLLVDLALADQNVYGARMTGGGFGGAVVIAARAGAERQVAAAVARAYEERSSRMATILVPP
jgi:galactokinase